MKLFPDIKHCIGVNDNFQTLAFLLSRGVRGGFVLVFTTSIDSKDEINDINDIKDNNDNNDINDINDITGITAPT